MMIESIADRLQDIKQRITSAAGGTGVALVAAGKSQPAESVREAIRAGVDAVGENRVQELLEKDAQGGYDGAPLHFIGRLQKNKASKLVGRVELIHSVDSLELAAIIDTCAGKLGLVQSVLVQVNIAGEETKGGFPPDALVSALQKLSPLRHIHIRGLMCIPPPAPGNSGSRYFEAMRRLFDDVRCKNIENAHMEILSMGMSDDYESAVRAGANMVRIGSALFGPRL